MTERRPIATSHAPAAIGPYSQALGGGGLVFTAGQLGLDPRSGELVAGGTTAEARQALANLAAILEAAGSGLDRVLKTTVYLVDMADYPAVNEVYRDAFGEPYPARTALAVAGLPRGARIEIECVALAAAPS